MGNIIFCFARPMQSQHPQGLLMSSSFNHLPSADWLIMPSIAEFPFFAFPRKIDLILQPVSASLKGESRHMRKKTYNKISNATRDELINLVEQNTQSMRKVAMALGINYSTAKSIMTSYRRNGRREKGGKRKKAEQVSQASPTPSKSTDEGESQVFTAPDDPITHPPSACLVLDSDLASVEEHESEDSLEEKLRGLEFTYDELFQIFESAEMSQRRIQASYMVKRHIY
eukprot:TRINITY_DN3782_c0_g1_i9.p1 TRINITY_DN3782_c0_g1~~TRINITY_DN3782_c0_g1_i9.p1  ORF type:complete len:228 (+),score=27.43 TRINITY_DN3782_c0_g1_i9:125-808(+)